MDSFYEDVVENILKKQSAFDNVETESPELSTSDLWLLLILNQTFGTLVYGEDKMVHFAEIFYKALEREE